MIFRWIGATFVLAGCGSWGFSMARAYHRQEVLLGQLSYLLRMMRWELAYRLTPVPDLCREAGRTASGILRKLFYSLSKKLEANEEPDVFRCTSAVLQDFSALPPKVKRILRHLGRTLGRYDLEGQLQGMDLLIQECEQEKRYLMEESDIRMRSYRTLGICAGAALIVLFI